MTLGCVRCCDEEQGRDGGNTILGKISGVIYLENIINLIDVKSWEEYLDSDENEEELNNLRKHTVTGHPLGMTVFIKKLSMSKRLRPKKKEECPEESKNILFS